MRHTLRLFILAAAVALVASACVSTDDPSRESPSMTQQKGLSSSFQSTELEQKETALPKPPGHEPRPISPMGEPCAVLGEEICKMTHTCCWDETAGPDDLGCFRCPDH